MKITGIVFAGQTPRPDRGWMHEKNMEMDPTWVVELEPSGVSVTTPTGNWLYPYSQIVRIQREDNVIDMAKRGPAMMPIAKAKP